MLRSAIMAAARSPRLEAALTKAPGTRGVVRRFVAGTDTVSAVGVASSLAAAGLTISLDHLGEDTTDRAQAELTAGAYLELLAALDAAGLTGRSGEHQPARTEVSVKLSAVGQALPRDGAEIALEQAGRICAAARDVGVGVTLDMEDHTTTDSTLAALSTLRADFPDTGAVLQAYLRRTESDCRDLATPGSRVRLCKGAYAEPPSVAYQRRDDVRASYRRCMQVLADGRGYPMFATHDPELIERGLDLTAGHAKDGFEFQMLYGIRPEEQKRLARLGNTVRVYVPYGAQWYGYLMRRLAERPANLAFFARSLLSKG